MAAKTMALMRKVQTEARELSNLLDVRSSKGGAKGNSGVLLMVGEKLTRERIDWDKKEFF